MSKLREMLNPVETETVVIHCKPIPIPVLFVLPDGVKEVMSLSEVKAIDGNRILRFYFIPNQGDMITFRGYLWEVLNRHHTCQIKGSNKPDQLPVVLTKYIGPV